MVRARVGFLFLVLLASQAHAATKLRLSQKDVAEMVLRQGQDTSEVNLTYLQSRLQPALVRRGYDWNLNVTTGYEFDKSETFDPGLTVPGSSYKRVRSSFSLTKTVATSGSIIGVDYNRVSQQARYDYIGPTTPAIAPNYTQDIFGFTFEQPLLNNSFGRADRAKIRAADAAFESGSILRSDKLENVVLTTIRAFWDAYVARETFKEALSSRERYQDLVKQVRRKNSYGYANPAELTQVQAEFESQEQSVKTNSTDYLRKVEILTTLLNIPAETEIDFVVHEAIPEVPKLSPVEVGKLRAIKAEGILIDSAKESLVASRSNSYPEVNLVGKLYSGGYDESAGTSFARATAGGHPKYYAGVKVTYNFGANYQNEEILNRKASLDLEESRLERRKLEVITALSQSERGVQSTFGIIQSAIKQKELREKAVRELNRSYGQGRTEIKTLIDAINNQFGTEVALSRAIGNYQIALNEWAAARDELVPQSKEEGK